MVWPRLLERVPAEIDPLIETMEAQPAGLAEALDDLKAKAADWRATSAPGEREVLAGTDLLPRIAEHLDLEERKVLALIGPDALLLHRAPGLRQVRRPPAQRGRFPGPSGSVSG